MSKCSNCGSLSFIIGFVSSGFNLLTQISISVKERNNQPVSKKFVFVTISSYIDYEIQLSSFAFSQHIEPLEYL